jgi:hypothetical protein
VTVPVKARLLRLICLIGLLVLWETPLASAQRVRFPEAPRVAAAWDDGWTSASSSSAQDGTASDPNTSSEPDTPAAGSLPATVPGSVSPIVPASPLSAFDPFAPSDPTIMTAPYTTQVQPCPPEAVWCEPSRPRIRYRLYGDYLYLNPGDAASTSVAVPINGAIIPPFNPRIPVGSVLRADPSFGSGFRFGFGIRPNQPSQWDASYTHYSTSEVQFAAIDPATGLVLESLLVHPATTAADTFFLDAAAESSVGFQLVDIDYRRYISDQCTHRMNFLFGARLAKLDQDLDSRFTNAISIEEVFSRVRFEGAGLRTGLEGTWMSPNTGFYVYGNAYASFLAGKFRSSFVQQDNFAGTVVDASYSDDRIVPLLDIELGVGWRSRNDRWYLSGGYTFSAWTNVVSTSSWITAVHDGAYDNIDDTLTFNGVTGRVEYRF